MLDKYFADQDHQKLAELLQKAYDATYPNLSLKEQNKLLGDFAYVTNNILPKIKNLTVGEMKLHEMPKEEAPKKKPARRTSTKKA